MILIICVVAVFVPVLALPTNNGIPLPKNIYVDPIAPPEHVPGYKIINGQEAVPHSIPYQVHLTFTGYPTGWTCGGSLITSKYVLTAAHCVVDALGVVVNLGAHNITAKESCQIRVQGVRMISHELYNSKNIDNDIGLIELAQNVYPTENIDYTVLPSLLDIGVSLEGYQARVSGWGITSRSTENRRTSDVLQEVTSSIIDNEKCDSYFGSVLYSEVCISGTGGRGACNGDSGGPLVIGDVQHGIVSYGARGCLEGYPTVFNRITEFLDWIESNSDWSCL